MAMKKIIVLLSVILIILVLCSCDNKIYHWEWEYEDVVSEIKEIHIVELNGSYQQFESSYKFNIIKTISTERYFEITDDIAKIDLSRNYGSPEVGSGKAFLIIFNNGEYDVFSYKQPYRMRYSNSDNSKELCYNLSLCRCDKEQFDALIDKYMSIE